MSNIRTTVPFLALTAVTNILMVVVISLLVNRYNVRSSGANSGESVRNAFLV